MNILRTEGNRFTNLSFLNEVFDSEQPQQVAFVVVAVQTLDFLFQFRNDGSRAPPVLRGHVLKECIGPVCVNITINFMHSTTETQ